MPLRRRLSLTALRRLFVRIRSVLRRRRDRRLAPGSLDIGPPGGTTVPWTLGPGAEAVEAPESPPAGNTESAAMTEGSAGTLSQPAKSAPLDRNNESLTSKVGFRIAQPERSSLHPGSFETPAPATGEWDGSQTLAIDAAEGVPRMREPSAPASEAAKQQVAAGEAGESPAASPPQEATRSTEASEPSGSPVVPRPTQDLQSEPSSPLAEAREPEAGPMTEPQSQAPDLSAAPGAQEADDAGAAAEAVAAEPPVSPAGVERPSPARDGSGQLLQELGVRSQAENRAGAQGTHPSGVPRAPTGPTPLPAPRPEPWERTPPRPGPGFELPGEYVRWNRVLGEHCLLGQGVEGTLAYLSITPRILSAALEVEDGTLLSPEEATQQFREAASAAYSVILGRPERLWVLSTPTPDGLPSSIGFLALSVLAAYEMRADDEAGPNAYYLRLADLLQSDLTGGRPRGFDPDDFADLWEMLSRWLGGVAGRTLALPGPEAGLRRFIAYPLCHVPLRQLDIEKLPDFFDWAGLEPGSKASPYALAAGLERWTSGRGLLTKSGKAALGDDRRSAVGAQVALELEAWDGSRIEAGGRRIAAVHLLLDFVRRRPRLDFLARRPASFPASFGAERRLDAGEQGWYDPTPVTPEDGRILRNGFVWTCSSPEGSFSLHRAPGTAIALSPTAEYSGFLSQRGLPLGVPSTVLCTSGVAGDVEEFLAAATGARCRPLEDPALPEGWRLFTDVRPTEAPAPPAGLEALEVQSNASVLLRGGVRLGRRAAWLAGAPPSVLIAGPDGMTASLDGKTTEIHEGVLKTTEPLDVGVHIVEASGTRRRFEIIEPEGRWDACARLLTLQNDVRPAPVALPAGSWYVIGRAPGEVAAASGPNGCLVVTPFRPVWAVSTGARRGSAVIALGDAPVLTLVPKFSPLEPGSSVATWVSAIYEAQIRRPRFAALREGADPDLVAAAWRCYVRAAKTLKRRRRRPA